MGKKMLVEKEVDRLSLYEKSLKNKSLTSNWPFQVSQKIEKRLHVHRKKASNCVSCKNAKAKLCLT